jgi:hypothetical protein
MIDWEPAEVRPALFISNASDRTILLPNGTNSRKQSAGLWTLAEAPWRVSVRRSGAESLGERGSAEVVVVDEDGADVFLHAQRSG